MTGLVLKLAPHERILINGAVIENGDRRSRLNIISPNANILRLRDAIHPEEANTPVRRLCYQAQLVLSGDIPSDQAGTQLSRGIEQLRPIFDDANSRELLTNASDSLDQQNYYQTLKALRGLLPREDQLFERAAGA